jgi:hypothetical protein
MVVGAGTVISAESGGAPNERRAKRAATYVFATREQRRVRDA